MTYFEVQSDFAKYDLFHTCLRKKRPSQVILNFFQRVFPFGPKWAIFLSILGDRKAKIGSVWLILSFKTVFGSIFPILYVCW